MEDRIVRDEERFRITGISRSAWWEGEKAGRFPKRRRLGPSSVGWLLSDLDAWMKSAPVGPADAPAVTRKRQRDAETKSRTTLFVSGARLMPMASPPAGCPSCAAGPEFLRLTVAKKAGERDMAGVFCSSCGTTSCVDDRAVIRFILASYRGEA